MELANSIRLRQRFRFESSVCIRPQNDSITALTPYVSRVGS